MPYIDVIPPNKATGLLKKLYDAALSRAGTDLRHCLHHEPQPPLHEGFAGFLWHAGARPLPAQPRAAGDACSRGFGREPLRVLNTIARPRLSRIALIRPVMIAIMEPPGSGDLGVCGMSFGER